MKKYIILKDGSKLEVDDTPYYIGEGDKLYIFAPNGLCSWGYVYVGIVEKEVEE